MKFSQIFRWLTAALLLVATWAILLERLYWEKVPTQISANFVYTLIAVNLIALILLGVAPSVLGLSTKTGKN